MGDQGDCGASRAGGAGGVCGWDWAGQVEGPGRPGELGASGVCLLDCRGKGDLKAGSEEQAGSVVGVWGVVGSRRVW